MQRMYRNRMSPPPPPPSFPFPMLASIPQPPMLPNQQLPYQAFVPPPPQLQNFLQMDPWVDYSAHLLEGFNQTHDR